MSKVGSNVVSLVVSKLVAGVLVLAGYAAIFRYLAPFKAGQFQFALSYVTLFSVAVDFGIQQLVIKRVSENKSEAKKYLGNFFAVEFLLALLIYALLLGIVFVRHVDPIVFETIAVIGLGMFINALTIPHTAIISAYEDMHLLAVVNFFDTLINVSVMALTILLHKGIVFLAIVQALMGVMHWLVYSRIIHRYVPEPQLFKYLRGLDFTLVRQMFLAALPFGMLVGFSIVYNKIDVIILSALRGYAETGLYTAAYKLFDFLTFFPAVVSSSLYPFFSAQMAAGNIALVKDTLQKYTKYMIGLAVPVAFGGAVLAQKLIVLIGGRQFLPGYAALEILVFGTAALFIYSGANSLMISQFTKYAVMVTFANIFINSIGNLLLIPHFGFRAAAAMTVVSELTQASFYFYFVRKRLGGFALWGNFVKPVICAALMALAIYPLRGGSLLITLPLGVLVYAGAILVSGYIKFSDFAAIKTMLLRRGAGGAAQDA